MSNLLGGLLRWLKTILTSGNKHMTNDEVKIETSVTVQFEPKIKSDNVLLLKRPVKDEFPISSPFGWRENPFKKGEQKFHNGVDFSVPVGTPVYAMASGSCYMAGWENPNNDKQGFGLRIWQESVIEGKTIYFWYGHLSKHEIKPVEQIKEGQLIGYSGNSGSSTGPHLHVQAREKNTGTLFDMEFYA